MNKEQEAHKLLLNVVINELEKNPKGSDTEDDLQQVVMNVIQLYTIYIKQHSEMLRLLFQTAINAKHRNSHNVIIKWVDKVKVVIETEVITLYKYGTNFNINFQDLTYQTIMDYLMYDYIDIPESHVL